MSARGFTLANPTVDTDDLLLRIDVAAAAGFDGIGVRPVDVDIAIARGLSVSELRSRLDDNGLTCSELHCVRGWAGDPSQTITARAEEDACYRVADALGGGLLLLASTNVADGLDGATAAAAAISARAADHGLRVAVEFMPWTFIGTARVAGRIVDGAGAANLGVLVDSWHYFRSGADEQALRDLGRERIAGVQIDDAATEVVGTLLQDTVERRLLPGEGAMDLIRFVQLLDGLGVDLPYSVEILSTTQRARRPGVAARMAAEATRQLLRHARE